MSDDARAALSVPWWPLQALGALGVILVFTLALGLTYGALWAEAGYLRLRR